MNAPMFSYVLGMAGINLYLLLPYIAYLALRRWAPPLAKRAIAAVRSRRESDGRPMPKSRGEVRFLSRRIEENLSNSWPPFRGTPPSAARRMRSR